MALRLQADINTTQWTAFLAELRDINKNLKVIQMTQAEATAAVNQLKDVVNNLANDIRALIEAVNTSGQTVTPELEAAITAAKTDADNADALYPPPPPPA